MSKIKVLVVDDSMMMRKVLTDILSSDPDIEVVGTAINGKTCLQKMPFLKPDVITLDIEMPVLNGLDTLKYIMEHNPTKVIMISAHTTEGAKETLEALEYGAVDFIKKPDGSINNMEQITESILGKIKAISSANLQKVASIASKKRTTTFPQTPAPQKAKPLKGETFADKIVAIGTSTGGPDALKEIFINKTMYENCAYLIVQHMPEKFTPLFADRLNSLSKIMVKEACDGDSVLFGHAYIAPGNKQMELQIRGGKPYLRVFDGEKVSGHRPSIDVMFRSVAKNFARKSVAVIMTGMGRDGASGIKEIRNKGGYTIAQDKDTSVVFGMNKEAIDEDGIDTVVSLHKIVEIVNEKICR